MKIDQFVYCNVLYHFIQKFLKGQKNISHTHSYGEIPGIYDEGSEISDTHVGYHKL